MGNTISCVAVIRDELPFLDIWFKKVRTWADEICIVECASVDGTHEYLERQPDIKHQVIAADAKQELGNAETINIAQKMATKDWVIVTSSDEMWDEVGIRNLKQILLTTKQPILNKTFDYSYNPQFNPDEWDAIIKTCKVLASATHVRIYPNNVGYIWKGYKHEEAFLGNKNAATLAAKSSLVLHHFTQFRTWMQYTKKLRWSYQLIRAYDNKSLRAGTSSWWYTNYCPKNEHWMRPLHDEYVRRKKAGEFV